VERPSGSLEAGESLTPRADIIGGVGLTAVFFDAGETLVYPHPSFAELFTEVLRSEGHVVDPAVVQEVVSAYSKKFTETVQSGEARLWSTSRERSRAFWDGVYRGFLHEVGVGEAHDRLVDRLYGTFSDLRSYRLHPDVVPTLDRLRAAGLSLGVVSNFEEWLERLLENLGVADYFPVRVISGIEGVEKPDPEIFQIALERSGVTAEESAYVGDHPYFDIDAAAEVGMVPVLIDRRGRYPDAEGIRITSLEDLPAAVGLGA
jgi:putative hydrolase of the HAD superfamily